MFVDDKAAGEGTITHVDGSTYTGQWKADAKHGAGGESWTDGSQYVGTFQENAKHGKGKLGGTLESF